jgi:hypothetical protein
MKLSTRRILSILASILVAFVVQIMLIVLYEEQHPAWLGALVSALGLYVPVFSSAVGFLFLVREFRFYAIPIALLYFTAMYWVLLYGSYVIAIILYGYRG